MDLQNLRQEIDKIDDDLLMLFKKRMDIALSVAKYKKENGLVITNAEREREILERMTEAAGEDIAIETKMLFTTLFDLSKGHQRNAINDGGELAEEIETAIIKTDKLFPKKAVVACQGVEGSYSSQACDALFPLPSIMFMNSFEAVFKAVSSGICRYGILPIENSSYGSVTEVYDLMKKHSFNIARSIKLKISHALLAKPGTKLEDIKEIFSHEQAIGQCSEFLGKLNIKVTPCENTAMAAKAVFESARNDIAAISSPKCADLYNLTAVLKDIQNTDNNYTKFICISKELEIYPGANKISMIVSLSHSPGALYRILSHFAASGLNLTKLQSRPVVGSDFEFVFYFDADASVSEPGTISLLNSIKNSCQEFNFLGNYIEV